ncbi:unnamed protein product [Adineta ricciae]|uniref:Uncharacterized protein n=1 Tax=Adineta ricciae TaxID=249248 RepID=A0A815R1H0_ADIRI|nr:unnamed protein product [Adineta ricciae]
MGTCSEKAKINLANIWKWNTSVDEKEALLAVGTKPEDDMDSIAQSICDDDCKCTLINMFIFSRDLSISTTP